MDSESMYSFDSIQDTIQELITLAEANDVDWEGILDHAFEQIQGNSDESEWIRAIFEASSWEDVERDWSEFAERAVTIQDMHRVQQQVQSELLVLQRDVRAGGYGS